MGGRLLWTYGTLKIRQLKCGSERFTFIMNGPYYKVQIRCLNSWPFPSILIMLYLLLLSSVWSLLWSFHNQFCYFVCFENPWRHTYTLWEYVVFWFPGMRTTVTNTLYWGHSGASKILNNLAFIEQRFVLSKRNFIKWVIVWCRN